ncbi:MAG: Rieske 2Fe-2S domain-containing protein [Lautropia sp.]
MAGPFVGNAWYVAAWSHEVDRSRLFCRSIVGIPMLLYRRGSGEPTCLQDRCCHRGAPLSKGRREGDDVRCLYHGLKFGSDGRCLEIPGQDRVPKAFRVRSFQVVERHRWIWVWPGDPDDADPALIPDCSSLDHPDWVHKPGYLHYEARQDLIADNLLDFSHVGFVHPTTLGGSERPAQTRVERLPRGVRVERWQLDDVPAPYQAQQRDFGGRVDRWNHYDFLLPGVLVMHSGVQAAGTGAPDGRIHDALEFRACQAVTPETEHSAHYFFALPRNFAQQDASVTEALFENVMTAFEEDRRMIYAQQRNLALDPDTPLLAIAADAALVHYRRVVQQQIAREARVPA